jgi:hypothetical protein
MFNSIEKTQLNQVFTTSTVADVPQHFSELTNDQFLEAIFGMPASAARPLICEKKGDPDKSGWQAQVSDSIYQILSRFFKFCYSKINRRGVWLQCLEGSITIRDHRGTVRKEGPMKDE